MSISFELINSASHQVVYSAQVALEPRVISEFHNCIPDLPHVNILLFGDAGTGKTSLMYTTLTAMNGKIIRNHPKLGPATATSNHATTSFTLVDVTNEITLMNTWGSDPSQYQFGEFELLLKGALPEELSMNDLPMARDERMRLLSLPEESRNKPDSIFFTLDVAHLENPESMKRLKGFISDCGKFRPDLNPFLIFTKINLVDPILKTDPFASSEKLNKLLDKASAETGIPKMNIFPTMTYTDEHSNVLAIDRQIINLFWTAVDSAVQSRQYDN